MPPPAEVWKPQPDRLPIGAVLQRSQIEPDFAPQGARAWVDLTAVDLNSY